MHQIRPTQRTFTTSTTFPLHVNKLPASAVGFGWHDLFVLFFWIRPPTLPEMSHSNERVSLHFTAEKPIEVGELTRALSSAARIYERTLKSQNQEIFEPDDYNLYVTKIEKNCIFAELAAHSLSALPAIGAMNYHNSIAQFVTHLDQYIAWFRGDKETLKSPPKKGETQDMANLLALATSPDGKGDLNVEQIEYVDGKRKSVNKLNYSPQVLTQAHAGTQDHLAALDAEEREIRRNVVLEISVLDIKRSKNDQKSLDKGVIAEIHNKEVRVSWESEMDGMRVKSPESTLENMEYIVDVQIARNSKGVPRIYRVLSVNEVVQ